MPNVNSLGQTTPQIVGAAQLTARDRGGAPVAAVFRKSPSGVRIHRTIGAKRRLGADEQTRDCVSGGAGGKARDEREPDVESGGAVGALLGEAEGFVVER